MDTNAKAGADLLASFLDKVIGYAPTFIMAILTLIIGLWIIGKLTQGLGKMMENRKIDASLRPFLLSIVGVLLKVMLLLSVAGMFGIQTTSFIAIFSAAVFAIGLALQGSLAHFASGVMIIIFKPYKVGDLVTAAGHTGHVEEIQVFNTILITFDNRKIIIPNGSVTSGAIINISGQGEIRVDMTSNISNGASIDQARMVIQNVANSCAKVLKNKAVDIFVNENQTGITQLAVRPWCKSEDYWDVYFYMQENIKKEFDKHGVAGPTPAMNVTVQK